MNKVDFTLKNGRIERMHPKIAELLQRKGKGTYQTRVVEQAPQRAVLAPAPAEDDWESRRLGADPEHAATAPPEHAEALKNAITSDSAPVDLASMSVEELREHAKRQGVQVHHRAGAKTVIDALKKAEE